MENDGKQLTLVEFQLLSHAKLRNHHLSLLPLLHSFGTRGWWWNRWKGPISALWGRKKAMAIFLRFREDLFGRTESVDWTKIAELTRDRSQPWHGWFHPSLCFLVAVHFPPQKEALFFLSNDRCSIWSLSDSTGPRNKSYLLISWSKVMGKAKSFLHLRRWFSHRASRTYPSETWHFEKPIIHGKRSPNQKSPVSHRNTSTISHHLKQRLQQNSPNLQQIFTDHTGAELQLFTAVFFRHKANILSVFGLRGPTVVRRIHWKTQQGKLQSTW